jgi:hypothetical protein
MIVHANEIFQTLGATISTSLKCILDSNCCVESAVAEEALIGQNATEVTNCEDLPLACSP